MTETYTFDASRPAQVDAVIADLKSLRGIHIVTIKRARGQISGAKRALYFAVYVRAYRKYFRDQGQPFTLDFCHYLLKHRFLKVDVYDKNTGEVIGEKVGSIADGGDVDDQQMSEFITNVHQFLAGDLGIEIPDVRGEFRPAEGRAA